MKFLLLLLSAFGLHAQLPFLTQPTRITTTSAAGLVVVQAAKNRGVSTTTCNVTISPAAGNLLVVGLVGYTGSENNHAPADNIDGTTGWTLVTKTNNSNTKMSLWFKANIPSGITTVTANCGAATTHAFGSVHEVSGASTSSPFTTGESVRNGTSGVTDYTPGNVTNLTADSVLFYFYAAPIAGTSVASGNFSGTTGVWGYKSSTNSREFDGGTAIEIWSMLNIIVTTTGSKNHHWGNLDGGNYSTALGAAFH